MAGYGSPLYGSGQNSPMPAPPAASTSSAAFGISRPKAHVETAKGGLFANDGSFIERFRVEREDDMEKKKAQDALARKKAMEDRFKKRGKRTAVAALGGDAADASASPSPGPGAAEVPPPAKRAKADAEPTDAYRREMRKAAGDQSLKDNGSGVRSLVR